MFELAIVAGASGFFFYTINSIVTASEEENQIISLDSKKTVLV